MIGSFFQNLVTISCHYARKNLPLKYCQQNNRTTIPPCSSPPYADKGYNWSAKAGIDVILVATNDKQCHYTIIVDSCTKFFPFTSSK